eukprot:TRINITY_DN8385_c0_g1_i1.p1 TRINITY_DN8385_c0_g1~~TRINITY_DN8385_c0_g1_i1.p1  ORF type:complete len:345 (+),score=116.01 TRINITY_DN8385_c0_g1_i1:86-1036(+)
MAIGSEKFNKEISELTQRIFTLLDYSTKISQNFFDPETMSDLFYKISNSYLDSPDLRIQWLNNLSSYHREHLNFEEAAQTKLVIGYLIVEYLQAKSSSLSPFPLDMSSFLTCCPNIHLVPSLPATSLEIDEGMYQSEVWGVCGLIDVLHDAISLLKETDSQELILEIYGILSEVNKASRRLPNLVENLSLYTDVAEKLLDLNKELRLFAVYYRIAFYGEKFGDLNNKEFLYKKPPKCNLLIIQNMLRAIYGHKAGGEENVVILTHNNPVGEKDFQGGQNKIFLQLASVNLLLIQTNLSLLFFVTSINVNLYLRREW